MNLHEKVVIIRNQTVNKEHKVLALDFEGTLVSNAISLFPRPCLYKFLEFCKINFGRIVIFTYVKQSFTLKICVIIKIRRSWEPVFRPPDLPKMGMTERGYLAL